MSKPKHCKGCMSHHNAGHPDKSPLSKKYNNWCTKYSNVAIKATSICIQQNGKTV